MKIILFDDKPHEKIGLKPNKSENLVNENKTGFIPFYTPTEVKKENNESSQ